uniref:WSN domain-containing protein n=1 Tax=Caenorhabditis tropicalis TaxID=1561998 RepID=A0A1I7UFN2_9PELO
MHRLKLRGGTKLLVLLVAIVTLGSSSIDYDEIQSQPDYDDIPPLDASRNEGCSGHGSSIFRRQANVEFETSLERMQKIARIMNGIYLARGISSDAISIDDFVSDILHLGKVTPSEIEKLDLLGLQNDLNKIVNLENSLISSKSVNLVEERYFVFDEIRKKTANMGNVADLKDAQNFTQELNRLINNKFDFQSSSELTNNITFFNMKVQEIKELSTKKMDPDDKVLAYKAIEKIMSFVESFKVYKKLPKPTKDFPTLLDDHFFNPIRIFLNGIAMVEKNRNVFSQTAGDQNLITTNVQILASMSSNSSSIESRMNSVIAILEARLDKSSSSFRHTFGFPGAASDIGLISGDLSDPWVKKVMATGFLINTFRHFNSIGGSAIIADSHFNSLSSKNQDSLEEMIRFGNSLSSFSDNSDWFGVAIQEINKCHVDNVQKPASTGDMENILKNTELLKNDLDEIREMKSFSDYFKNNEKLLNNVLTIPTVNKTNPNYLEEVPEITKKLYQDKSFQKLANDLASLIRSSNVGTLIDRLPSSAKNVSDAFQKLSAFQSAAENSAKAFKCLNDIQNVGQVSTVIDALRDYRKRSYNPFNEGVEVIERVVKASDGVMKMKEAMKSMKEEIKGAGEKLETFEPIEKDSIIFGTATRGIANMKTAIGHEKSFNNVKNEFKLVDDEIKTARNLPPDDNRNLQMLPNVASELQSFASSFDVYKKKSQLPDSTSLSKYSPLFSEAIQVTGVDENLHNISKSVQFLENNSNDANKKIKLSALRETLDDLHSE